MESVARLPDPGPEEIALGAALTREIIALIEREGSIGFDRYMQQALYAPGLGYYVGGMQKFGPGGDFVTAPEISSLYGASIARQCQQVLASHGGSILEFGAGSGRLALSILQTLAHAGRLPDRYFILELSPELRQRQAETLAALEPGPRSCVEWLTAPPARPLVGVVIANEILDALPVKVFKIANNVLYERRVGVVDEKLAWCDQLADAALAQEVHVTLGAAYTTLAQPYCAEINLAMRAWIGDLAGFLARGIAIIADYGATRHEYYHPTRSQGTLMCHYRHRAHDDPFLYPGLQDITASVDFTAVAEAASASGLQVLGYADQASFLLACGITELLEQRINRGDADPTGLAQQAKKLLLPTAMGTRFKFIVLGKAVAGPLIGFSLRDDRHRL